MVEGANGDGRGVLVFPEVESILLAVGAVGPGAKAEIFFEATHAIECSNCTDVYVFDGDDTDQGPDDSRGGFMGTFFRCGEAAWSLAQSDG
jgi:hypothetical protein